MSLLLLYLGKMRRSAKERQSKPGFLSWAGCNPVTENDPVMKILHEKDIMAIQECSHVV